jgi:hypothetical protein
MLPSPRLLDGRATPHAGSSVEIEENVAARPARVLKHEVPVEKNGFDFGEKGIVAVDVRPARLHHSDFRIGEVVNGAQQKVRWGHEVGVEDGDEFAPGGPHALGERSRLVAFRSKRW